MAVTRREALSRLAVAGAGTVLAPSMIRGQKAPIMVAGRPVEIAVRTISDSTIRITVLPIVNDKPQPVINRGALVEPLGGNEQKVATRDMVVSVREGATTTITVRRRGRIVQTLSLSSDESTIAFSAGSGQIFGLGEGGPQFDRRGTSYPSRNGQGGYQLRTHGGRVPIQWLVSTDGWGMYIHQPLGSFDLMGSIGRLMPTSDALPIDIFIVAADDPKTIIGEYARITGYAELPPLWSFGYMQSHRTLTGPDEISWVARTFREKKLPCDALIYLGTEFTPSGWNTRNGEFGWKTENFPDPKKFIDEMHAQHYKVVLHIVIEGQRMSGAVADPCTPDKAVPSGRTPEDRWPPDRAVPC
ncbi:MAG TPA: TIM-barrel domain-containing protein, partial [Vicinamibacterales bacterium]|nr:TIM-barrel domain-containing protein [Vicinamibacterales bacterium]